ncbi:MAG TPA: amidohydrolase family protein [Nocardioidaceae bacterium]|nr:amidohydrolase family protein [Nocardioidaceae bacterium]
MTASLSGVVPGIIDTHIHQWDPFANPTPTSSVAKLNRMAPWLVDLLWKSVIPREVKEFLRTKDNVLHRYLPETYAADIGPVEVPVEGVVHVQADWRGKGPMGPVGETRWLETLPFGQGGLPKLMGIVGAADPREPHFAALLDAHQEASPVFRGIRCMGAWHADKHVHKYGDVAGLFRQPEFLGGFAALAERDLTFDAYVYSHQLDDVTLLAQEYPDTTIVLDHYAPLVGWGGPMGSQGATAAERAALFDQWHDAISRLAERPNVVAKHSGLAFPMNGFPTTTYTRSMVADVAGPLVEHTTDVFGPDRLMFGSNFPMDKALAPYDAVVGALTDLLAPRGEELLRKVFRENALRIYSLE